MLARVVPRKEDCTSSFHDLLRYNTRTKGKEFISASQHVDPADVVKEMSAGDIVCFHNCFSLETAAEEMKNTASMSKRVKDPVYHFVVSWQEGEEVNDDVAYACCQKALEALGAEEHEHVVAIHRDTDNIHAHVMFNRVHPATHKALSKHNSYRNLSKAMRECELEYGFRKDNGMHQMVLDEHGRFEIVENERNNAPAHEKQTFHANRMEHFGAKESFQSYARKVARRHIVPAIKDGRIRNWETLHLIAGMHGIAFQEVGKSGLVAYNNSSDKNTRYFVKNSALASELTKSFLCPKLGEYQPFTKQALLQREYRDINPDGIKLGKGSRASNRAKSRKRLYALYREERNAHIKENAYDFSIARKRFLSIRDWTKTESEYVFWEYRKDRDKRNMLLTAIKFEAQRKRLHVYSIYKQEKHEHYARIKSEFPVYQEWIGIKAQQGNPDAIRFMRGQYYAQQRKEALKTAEEQRLNAMRTPSITVGRPAGTARTVDESMTMPQRKKPIVDDKYLDPDMQKHTLEETIAMLGQERYDAIMAARAEKQALKDARRERMKPKPVLRENDAGDRIRTHTEHDESTAAKTNEQSVLSNAISSSNAEEKRTGNQISKDSLLKNTSGISPHVP